VKAQWIWHVFDVFGVYILASQKLTNQSLVRAGLWVLMRVSSETQGIRVGVVAGRECRYGLRLRYSH